MIKICLFDDKICQNCRQFKAEQITDALYGYGQNEIYYRHIIRCANDDICASIRDHIRSQIEKENKNGIR